MANKKLLTEIGICSEFVGVDLRIILLCYENQRTQKELGEMLQTNKSNISSHVGRLEKMGVLHKMLDGVYRYKVNRDWTDNQVPGQITL